MTVLSMSEHRKPKGYIASLDGVRGLAILMVLGSHLFWSNYTTSGPMVRFVGDALRYGFFGVDLFFVLSGFLITGILVDSLHDQRFFQKFYVRRVLRIFPLYYGVLLILFVVTPLLSLRWHGMGWLFALYLQTARPQELSNFSPGSGIGLSHFWSLAIEEQFYMVWPALVFWIRDRRKLMVATVAISAAALALRMVLVGAGVAQIAIHMTTITRVDTLLLGGTLALLYRSIHWSTVQRVAPFGLLACSVAVAASIKLLPREFFPAPEPSTAVRLWVDGLRYTVLALGAACLISWSMRAGSVCQRFFETRVLRFFGRYSYGIYILHVLLLPVLLSRQRAAIEHATHSKLLAVVGAGLSALAISVAAAVLSFHLYEKPFLRLKRFFDYGTNGPQPQKSVGEGPRRFGVGLVSSENRRRVSSLR